MDGGKWRYKLRGFLGLVGFRGGLKCSYVFGLLLIVVVKVMGLRKTTDNEEEMVEDFEVWK